MHTLIAFIIITIAMFGFLLPWLFSAASWYAVGAGVAFFIAYAYSALMLLSSFQAIFEKKDSDE